MECSPNAHIWFCAEHRFWSSGTILPLTWKMGYDMINVLGRIFPSCFFFYPGNTGTAVPRPPSRVLGCRTTERPHVQRNDRWRRANSLAPGTARKEMTPDFCRGSFLFLGFNHWVTSLSAGSTGLCVWLESLPQHSCFSTNNCDWHLCKTEDIEAQPAGVLTISGITFFRTISLPCLKTFFKTGFPTNNFRINGIKRRNPYFWSINNWHQLDAVIRW